VGALAKLQEKSAEIPTIFTGGKKFEIFIQILIPLLFGVPPFRTGGLFRKYKKRQGLMVGIPHGTNRVGV